MMNARAKAYVALREEDIDRALAEVNSGLEKIRTFFEEHGQPQLVSKSNEVQALLELRDELISRRPQSRLDVLRQRLAEAIEREQYERAARLRDEIRRLEEGETPRAEGPSNPENRRAEGPERP
jgi:excinuclease UvrABC nuclease subunit